MSKHSSGEILVKIGGYIYPVDLSDEIQSGFCEYDVHKGQQLHVQDAGQDFQEAPSSESSYVPTYAVLNGPGNTCVSTVIKSEPIEMTTDSQNCMNVHTETPTSYLTLQNMVPCDRATFDPQPAKQTKDNDIYAYNWDQQNQNDSHSNAFGRANLNVKEEYSPVGISTQINDNDNVIYAYKWDQDNQNYSRANILDITNLNVKEERFPVGISSTYDFSHYYAQLIAYKDRRKTLITESFADNCCRQDDNANCVSPPCGHSKDTAKQDSPPPWCHSRETAKQDSPPPCCHSSEIETENSQSGFDSSEIVRQDSPSCCDSSEIARQDSPPSCHSSEISKQDSSPFCHSSPTTKQDSPSCFRSSKAAKPETVLSKEGSIDHTTSENETSAVKVKDIPELDVPIRRRRRCRHRRERGCKIWEFIRNLLLDPGTNPSLICWENKEEGMFRLKQPRTISQMWGLKKGNVYMNYEKLSRAMRYHYKKKILAPVKGKNLMYRFGPCATGWK